MRIVINILSGLQIVFLQENNLRKALI